jgi:hypothetical protein
LEAVGERGEGAVEGVGGLAEDGAVAAHSVGIKLI